MLIFRDLTEAPSPTAVALGYFDGVHLGHKAVIKAAVECKKEGLIPAVFTFSSTPKRGTEQSQLTSFDEKVRIFEQIGVEILYIIDFEILRNKTPDEFVGEVLKKIFRAEKVFCGYNYHFGKDGKATGDDLTRICDKYGIKASVKKPVKLGNEYVSSTKIREYLKSGDIVNANKMLGYDFGIVSESVEGRHIGTAMNTPTINQNFESNKILPRFGVYASEVFVDGERYIGVTNIGVKPTIAEGNAPNCETWMPLYNGGELYGKRVEVRLAEFIRPEKKFGSLSELEKAIKHDGETAVKIVNFLRSVSASQNEL